MRRRLLDANPLLENKSIKRDNVRRIPWPIGGALSAVRAQCNYLGVWPE